MQADFKVQDNVEVVEVGGAELTQPLLHITGMTCSLL